MSDQPFVFDTILERVLNLGMTVILAVHKQH